MAANGLITDLYQLTMANALFKKGMHERRVVFDRFYRKNPFNGGYTVVAGLAHLQEFAENFRFDADDIAYLKSLGIFYPEFLDYLADFRFTGDIYAMPEGTVAFPGELLLRFHGTTTEAMLMETGLSMIMNHESLIATKTRRVRTVAGKDALMEFGLRRAQGHSAGLWGARAAMIGGFNGTSNVEAGKLFGIPVLGTMAHSWIMSFDTEIEAFEEYVKQYHNNLILLADTYNVLEMGVPDAIRIFKELKAKGELPKVYGIRIDSGDLGYLSKEAKRMFTEAGFPDAIISGSNDLDEYLIQSLKEQGCTVTSWGVGTKIITADGSPSLGGVFKMSAREKDGIFRPVMKLKTIVSMVKEMQPGQSASYGRRFTAEKPTKVATLCAGYADGYPRLLSCGKGIVEIKGMPCPVLGRVCMDQIMVDVSALPDVQEGDEAILWGGEVSDSAETIAHKTDTISYEVLCGVSRRVPRVYLENGGIKAVEDWIL